MDIKFKFKGEGIAYDADYVPTPEEVEKVMRKMLASEMGVHATIAVSKVKVLEE